MTRAVARLLVPGALLVGALLTSPPARASGVASDDDDRLGQLPSPDDADAFIGGRLGVVSDTLWPRWRAVAFRVLAGPPLDPVTRKALANHDPDDKAPSPVKDWITARATVTGVAPPPRLPDARYGYDYGNCYADAFTTAIATLKERQRRFGADSKDAREWLTGQDLVFANCDGGDALVPPDKVAAGVAPAVQKDRDYQVAAALFYAKKLPEAQAAFEKVAADRGSPWAPTARFVVARTLLRRATLGDTPDAALLADAEKRLVALLADPKAAPLHASARRLVNFIAFRTRPDAQLLTLGELLAKGGGEDAGLVLTDFAWLADKMGQPKLADLDKVASSELTEWTLTWGAAPADRASRALQRWHEKKSVPWLLLALAAVEPGHAEAKALLEAARAVKAGQPGYATAVYHRARLLNGQARYPAARALLDEALAQRDLPRDARNLLFDERWDTAKNLDDALGFVARMPLHGEPILSPAAATLFLQYVPIAESARGAADARVPAPVKGRILRAAWMRAALLDDAALAGTIAGLAAGDAELQALHKEWSAATGDLRRFALVHAWLRNDWSLNAGGFVGSCGQSSPALGKPPTDGSNYGPPPAPIFVSAALRDRARAESTRIDALVGEPSTFRANQTAAFARAHKDDPRVEEDLHLAVNGTKHSCDDKATAASKAAWKVLHNQYPNGDWTRRTKYWYP